jgi:hypothetical protein
MTIENEDATRAAAVAWVQQWAGLVANPDGAVDDWDRYLTLIAHNEDAATARAMGRASGCALFARAYLRAILLDVPACLTRPYVTGHAVSDVHGIALAAGAVRTPSAHVDFVPRPGDIVRVNSPEHVYVVTSVAERPYGFDVESVDGGQVVSGCQAIEARVRTIEVGANSWSDRAEGSGVVRVVASVYDLAAMVTHYGAGEALG